MSGLSNGKKVPSHPRHNTINLKQPNGVTSYLAIVASYSYDGFAPPPWVGAQAQRLLDRYGHKSVCYYHSGADLQVVKDLLTQREPVNIGGNQLFDEDKMEDDFGWNEGYYNRYFEERQTPPPNIAVYCLSPVVPSSDSQEGDGSSPIVPYPVHMLHSIGYAFDKRHQADYQHLIRGVQLQDPIGMDALRQKLTTLYTALFRLVFACAREKECSFVCLGLVGAGVFAAMYPGGCEDLRSDVWVPALEQAIAHAHWDRTRLHIMGDEQTGDFTMAGYFPQCIPSYPEDTLFVNAWDPLSMVGNGNEGDNSLDGHFGRCSASALLCWPMANINMGYHAVRDHCSETDGGGQSPLILIGSREVIL
jgi:hypothetical protein